MSKPSTTNCPKLHAAVQMSCCTARADLLKAVFAFELKEMLHVACSRDIFSHFECAFRSGRPRCPPARQSTKCSRNIPVVIALWFHLFPFRTEKLSTVAPMVLHTRGRVGRRHFTRGLVLKRTEPLIFLYMRAQKKAEREVKPAAPLVLLI